MPIGLVASDVGGVKIETLMSADALVDASCGGTAYAPGNASEVHAAKAYPQLLDADADADALPGAGALELELGERLGAGPGDVWNGMIYPLLPMRFTGVVFYQGESNSLAGCPSAYACLWPALITDWRHKFDLADLGFFFVQLAAYGWHGRHTATRPLLPTPAAAHVRAVPCKAPS